MRRFWSALLALCLFLAVTPSRAAAVQQSLEVLSYKFYPLQDVAFVDVFNPHFAAIDNIVVNMVIREGTGRNRVIAIGQTLLPADLALRPGEHVSARVPIRARVVRDIPAIAQFEFRIAGNQRDADAALPDVVIQDSTNGTTMEFNRDVDGVPMVFGFISLSLESGDDVQAAVSGAVLTFYDKDRKIVWSEYMPIGATLAKNDFHMIWGKYQHLSRSLVPDISTVDIKFIVTGQN